MSLQSRIDLFKWDGQGGVVAENFVDNHPLYFETGRNPKHEDFRFEKQEDIQILR